MEPRPFQRHPRLPPSAFTIRPVFGFPLMQPIRPPRPGGPTSANSSRRRHSSQSGKSIVERNRSGIVLNYATSAGWGFIKVYDEVNKKNDYPNMFVHHSGLTCTSLDEGDAVSFDIAAGRKGFEAINVKHLASVTEELSVRPRPVATSSHSDDEILDCRGEVIDYDVVKRYGIVKRFDNEQTVLAHHSKFKPPLVDLQIGDVIKFNIVKGVKGPTADQVEIVSGAKATASRRSRSKSASRPSANKRRPQDRSLSESLSAAGDEPNIVAAAIEELQCCVCLELLSINSVQTPCEHYFCRDCITEWIESERAKCPLCNKRLVKDQLQPIPRVLRNLIEKAHAK